MLGAIGIGAAVTTVGGTWVAATRVFGSTENQFPMFRYDAANTGTVPEVSGPTGAITSLFEFGRSSFTPSHRMGSPSLRDGRLYLTEGRIDGAGERETFVYAVDAIEGNREWATMYRGTNAAGPTASR